MNNEWHQGPPPSVGWWPASERWDPNSLRWWNGRHWSLSAMPMDASKIAGYRASRESALPNEMIQWQDRPEYWPARSRGEE